MSWRSVLLALAQGGVWLLKQPFLLAGWIIAELCGQAKTGAKKAIRPFLWPAVGVGMFLFLYATLDPRAFAALLQVALTVLITCGAVWLIFRGMFPRKKKKKT